LTTKIEFETHETTRKDDVSTPKATCHGTLTISYMTISMTTMSHRRRYSLADEMIHFRRLEVPWRMSPLMSERFGCFKLPISNPYFCSPMLRVELRRCAPTCAAGVGCPRTLRHAPARRS